jgi:ribosomal subunit interface protein
VSFRIHYRDLPHADDLRSDCERWAEELRAEFPETSKVEVTVARDGVFHSAQVHVTGKELELAASAENHDLHASAAEAFDKARRQLRKRHDKQIFVHRREAQKHRS